MPIGEWVLRTACRQAAIWREVGHPGFRMAVNVSAQQFQEPWFAGMVTSALEESGLRPPALELEITERNLLRNDERTLETLQTLKGLGIALSIDDFGTGYSALSYLKRLPVDALKIDQSFVAGLTTDPADAIIAESVVRMAAGLNLVTVAEGVESLEQLHLLGAFGCTRMQGFLFGRPVPAEAFEEWLREPPFPWMRPVPRG